MYETNTEPVRYGYGRVDCIDDLKTEYEFECYLTKTSNVTLTPIDITQEKQTELVMPHGIGAFNISQCLVSSIRPKESDDSDDWKYVPSVCLL